MCGLKGFQNSLLNFLKVSLTSEFREESVVTDSDAALCLHLPNIFAVTSLLCSVLVFAHFLIITQFSCLPATSGSCTGPLIPPLLLYQSKQKYFKKSLLTIEGSHENSNSKNTSVQYKIPLVGLNFLESRSQTVLCESLSSPRTCGLHVRTMTHTCTFIYMLSSHTHAQI